MAAVPVTKRAKREASIDALLAAALKQFVEQGYQHTTVEAIERCSGHDGTYAVKKEFHEISKKIARPVVNKVKKGEADHFVSDCPMAADQITQDLDNYDAGHPMSLLRKAYGI